MENKTGKPAWPAGRYFKYAIGEIVLVVIGILIALGINNWNENRKTEEKIKQFLVNLKSELRNDLTEIKVVTEAQIERSNRITQAIELSNNSNVETIILTDSIKYYDPGNNFTFFPTVGSYNAANNAGLIDNINNVELKRSILDLYEHLYPRVVYNGAILDERTGQFEWNSKRYWDILNESYTFNKQAILDEDFPFQLGYVNRFIRVYLMRCNDTQSGIEDVLNNIDKYLHLEPVEK
ncbi:MAG: DUF6090 family protein [Lutimonas sp.]